MSQLSPSRHACRSLSHRAVSRTCARRLATLGLLLGAASTSASAQTSLLGTQLGSTAGARAGWSLDGGRDVDGDGVPDIVVGAPNEAIPSADCGAVRAWSGADSSLLWSASGDPDDLLGICVRFVDDLDGDGVADVITSTPAADAPGATPIHLAGFVRALSGKTGAILWDRRGDWEYGQLGVTCDVVGDLNGDGRPEIVSGAFGFNHVFPKLKESGLVGIYDGATGATLHVLYGQSANAYFGHITAGVGDWDGDGVPDFAAGSPNMDANGVDSGRVQVFSGATMLELASFVGAPGERMGVSIASPGDVDGDGLDDMAVSSVPSSGVATVTLRRGGSGVVLWTRTGGAETAFGASVRPAGDVNHDGVGDVVVGAPYEGVGAVHVFSGPSGKTLWTPITALVPDGQFGLCAANAGDVDGDGWLDLVIGQPGYGGALAGQGLSQIVTHVVHAVETGWQPLGNARVAMWGGGLSLGEVMDLRAKNLSPNHIAWFVISPFGTPTPFKGGTLVPDIGSGFVFSLTASPLGEIFIPGIPGGLYDGSLWVQCLQPNSAYPKGFVISNAIVTPVSTS